MLASGGHNEMKPRLLHPCRCTRALCSTGVRNAFLLELGADNALHRALRSNPYHCANSSVLLRLWDAGSIIWQVLVDCGQGLAPMLIHLGNRLPDAVVITHPHFDHFVGLDHLEMSFHRHAGGGKRLPLIATEPCYERMLTTLGHIKKYVDFRPIWPRSPYRVPEAPGLVVTPYPVFHGGHAPGASLLEFRMGERKIIASGDPLTPLLTAADVQQLTTPDLLIVDANTRFPSPTTGHWSIVGYGPSDPRGLPGDGEALHSEALRDWVDQHTLADLVTQYSPALPSQGLRKEALLYSVMDFVSRVQPKAVGHIHYSGFEDTRDYRMPILNPSELLSWVTEQAALVGLPTDIWSVPQAGDAVQFVIKEPGSTD